MTKKTKKSSLKRTAIAIVVLIILIISSIWFLIKQEQIKESQNIQRVKDIKYIGQLIEEYHNQYGIYPCALNNTSCSWEQELLKVSKGVSIPRDPLTNIEYKYLNNGMNSVIATNIAKSFMSVCYNYPDHVKSWYFYRTIDNQTSAGCADELEELHSLWKPIK